MPAIHVRSVPAEVVAALKDRARKHGWSMQREVLDILSEATSGAPEPVEFAPVVLITTQAGGDGDYRREAIYGDGR